MLIFGGVYIGRLRMVKLQKFLEHLTVLGDFQLGSPPDLGRSLWISLEVAGGFKGFDEYVFQITAATSNWFIDKTWYKPIVVFCCWYCWWFRNPANSPVEVSQVTIPWFTKWFFLYESKTVVGALGFLKHPVWYVDWLMYIPQHRWEDDFQGWWLMLICVSNFSFPAREKKHKNT